MGTLFYINSAEERIEICKCPLFGHDAELVGRSTSFVDPANPEAFAISIKSEEGNWIYYRRMYYIKEFAKIDITLVPDDTSYKGYIMASGSTAPHLTQAAENKLLNWFYHNRHNFLPHIPELIKIQVQKTLDERTQRAQEHEEHLLSQWKAHEQQKQSQFWEQVLLDKCGIGLAQVFATIGFHQNLDIHKNFRGQYQRGEIIGMDISHNQQYPYEALVTIMMHTWPFDMKSYLDKYGTIAAQTYFDPIYQALTS